MRQVLVTESSLRGLLRELLDSDSPIHANPVVDPQAAETDPTNQNFIPTNRMELMSALRMIASSVEDDEVPDVYVAVKDIIEKENEMKDTTAESIVRRAVRKILKESLLNEAAPSRFDIASKSTVQIKPKKINEPQKLSPDVRYQVYKPGVSGPATQSEESAEERYKKDVADLKIRLDKYTFLSDAGEKEKEELAGSIVGSPESFEIITDDDVQRFFNAYEKTEYELKEKDPVKIINSKSFNKNFGENFNKFSETKGKAVLASLQKKGYFKGADSSLKTIADEMDLSISGVKKLSNIALGKFVIAGKAILKFESFLKEPSIELEPSAWDPE